MTRMAAEYSVQFQRKNAVSWMTVWYSLTKYGFSRSTSYRMDFGDGNECYHWVLFMLFILFSRYVKIGSAVPLRRYEGCINVLLIMFVETFV